MEPSLKMRNRKIIPVGDADIQPGKRKLIDVDGKNIGIFNVGGQYFALLNRCPHMSGPLCEGPICGTAIAVNEDGNFIFGFDGELVRCGWHGWEFEIKTGKALVDDSLQVRKYEISVKNRQLFIHI